MSDAPPKSNLGVCSEHGLMKHSASGSGVCPVCPIADDVDVDIRRDAEMPGPPPKHEDITRRMEDDDLTRLYPVMVEYVEDRWPDEGDVYLTVVRIQQDTLPAGYSEAQERHLNVLVYETDWSEKAIVQGPAARETVENLHEEGYGNG